jgi:hypothetical protein
MLQSREYYFMQVRAMIDAAMRIPGAEGLIITVEASSRNGSIFRPVRMIVEPVEEEPDVAIS